MRAVKRFLAASGLLALLLTSSQPARGQVSGATGPVQMIEVTDAQPIAAALGKISMTYGVPLDYSDPVYLSNRDTQLLYVENGQRVRVPPLIPRIYTLRFTYATKPGPQGSETVGEPVEGMTAMISRLLAEFAAEGGPVFGVKKFATAYGQRWEVYPVKARDALDRFVDQPDYLGAIMHIPPAERTEPEMIDLIAGQLTKTWGRDFRFIGSEVFMNDVGVPLPRAALGAENISARQALQNLMGAGAALRMLYVPGKDAFMVNLVGVPNPPAPRPPIPPPPQAISEPRPAPPAVWMLRARTPKGRQQIQTALSRAGYLRAAPTGKWDANAADAIRRLQAANGLPTTGTLDQQTIFKLEPFLPEQVPGRRPYVPMSHELALWLQSTRRGWTEVQTALTTAGYYKGATTGTLDQKTHEALIAYQNANGLPATGVLDYKTAEKLAPLLPKPQ